LKFLENASADKKKEDEKESESGSGSESDESFSDDDEIGKEKRRVKQEKGDPNDLFALAGLQDKKKKLVKPGPD